MNKPMGKQHRTPSNHPDDGNAFSMMLEAMSVEELTDALNDALENMTEENYDPAWIDAYLAALDRKDPMPEIPDAEASYASFPVLSKQAVEKSVDYLKKYNKDKKFEKDVNCILNVVVYAI